MLQLIRSIVIAVHHRVWRLECLVRLPAGIKEAHVSVTGLKLYPTLKELLRLARDKERELWEEQRKPKQQSFNYGLSSPDKVE